MQPHDPLRPQGLSLATLIDRIAEGWAAAELLGPLREAEEIPRSLLIRLLHHSAFLAHATVGQVQAEGRGEGRPALLDPLFTFQDNVTAVEEARRRFRAADAREPELASEVLGHARFVAEILDGLELWKDPAERTPEEQAGVKRRLAGRERALRATLDTAAHRIDPWITGLAWRRLQATVNGPAANVRLGVYGWLDGPTWARPVQPKGACSTPRRTPRPSPP